MKERGGDDTAWTAGKRTFAHSLERAHLSAILHHVNGEVDLGERLLLLNCANGIVDLGGPSRRLIGVVAIGVHGRRLECVEELRGRRN